MVAKKSRTVEGYLECGTDGVMVLPECLGQEFSTKIAGRALTISLPRFVGSAIGRIVPPRFSITVALDDKYWGTTTLSRGGEPVIAHVVAVRFALSVLGSEDEAAEQVVSESRSWWSCVSAWLDVSGEIDVATPPIRQDLAVGAHPRVWGFGGDEPSRAINLPTVMEVSASLQGQDNAVGRELLQRCLTAAGRGDLPPLEWQFIRDARSNLRAGDTRRAVIDAATAAELAMQIDVDRLLATSADNVRKALTVKYQTVTGLADLWKRLGGTPVPERLQQVLAEPRNAAAHKGVAPSGPDARAAVELATKVVEGVTPLANLMTV